MLTADELERCVRDHKFKGAMINGYTNVADARVAVVTPVALGSSVSWCAAPVPAARSLRPVVPPASASS